MRIVFSHWVWLEASSSIAHHYFYLSDPYTILINRQTCSLPKMSILTPGTYEYVMLHGKGNSDGIKVIYQLTLR